MKEIYQCEVCSRVFKNKLGLVSHSKKCKAIEVPTSQEEDLGIESIGEVSIKLVDPVTEVKEAMNNIDSEIERRLNRLKYDIRNCYDASTRYRLECEYFELGGTRDSLNK